jgi:hypothetical protein
MVASSIIETAETLSSSLITPPVLGKVHISTAVASLTFSSRDQGGAKITVAAFFTLFAFITRLEIK